VEEKALKLLTSKDIKDQLRFTIYARIHRTYGTALEGSRASFLTADKITIEKSS